VFSFEVKECFDQENVRGEDDKENGLYESLDLEGLVEIELSKENNF